jgi:uncharacterized protein YmfQ (DUF2313 family)
MSGRHGRHRHDQERSKEFYSHQLGTQGATMTTTYQMAIAGAISATMALDKRAGQWVRKIEIIDDRGSRPMTAPERRTFITAQSEVLRHALEEQFYQEVL